MARSTYIWSFVSLALMFVPVFGYFIFAWIVAPWWVLLYVMLHASDSLTFFSAFISVCIFPALFYAGARMSYRLIDYSTARPTRLFLQSTVMAGLFSCSFLSVLSINGMLTGTDTYDLWGALHHYWVTGRTFDF